MTISFHGAAGCVTGSKHIIELDNKEKILLDCGMFQGMGPETYELNEHFGFDPEEIDYLILSHAHIDHSGLIPRLVKQGFKGNIYCTRATADLCEIMLMDSAHILEADARFINKRRLRQDRPLVKPLYTKEDVSTALEKFVKLDYDTTVNLNENISLFFTDNGHILGSGAVNLTISENGKTKKFFFSGDIGRYDTPLLKDPTPFPQPDIIISESTYGDRLHQKDIEADQELLDIILHTCTKKKGKVIIPAFSLGRTQEIVFALNKLDLHGLLPSVKIYVDSPLAVNATEIMRKYASSLDAEVQRFISSRPDPFGFDQLTYITDKKESQAINHSEEPCIIISASGMAEAGRIKHHIAHNISKSKNTIVLVGYASPQSLSGRLKKGDKQVKIFGDYYEVVAEVRSIDSLSAHADHQEMIKYLSCIDAKKVEQFFLVHGDPQAQENFKVELLAAGFHNIHIPELHQSFEI